MMNGKNRLGHDQPTNHSITKTTAVFQHASENEGIVTVLQMPTTTANFLQLKFG